MKCLHAVLPPALWKRSPLRPAIVALVLTISACGQADPAERLERAQASFTSGDHRVALIEVRNVLQQDPDNRDARILLGRVSLVLGDYETSAHELQRVDVAARDVNWLTASAAVYEAEGRLARATEVYREARDQDPQNYRALVGEARVAFRRGLLDDANRLADLAVSSFADQPEGYLIRGEIQLQTRNMAAAERDFARAAELLATGPVTAAEVSNLIRLAQLQLTLNRADALRVTADLARSRAQGSPAAEYIAGAAAYMAGRFEDSSRSLQRALAQVPDEPHILLLLGATHVSLRNYGQAEQSLLALLDQRAGDPVAIRLLAETRRRQGRHAQALEVLSRSPVADRDPALIGLRGLLHLDAGQPGLAVPLLENAVQLSPGEPVLQLQLARAYFASGQTDRAVAMFEEPLGAGAADAVSVAVSLFEGLTDSDQLGEARARSDALVEANPDDVHTLMGVALFRQAIGDRTQAVQFLERAVAQDGAFVPAALVLAGLSVSDGNLEQARLLFESVTEQAPDNHHAWLGLAQVAAANQALDESGAFARQAARAAPQAVTPLLYIAQIEIIRGDFEAAWQPVQEAARLAPGNPDVLTYSGLLALQREQPETALASFWAAAEAESGRADRWHNLGRTQRLAGELEEARVSLLRANGLAPANGAVRYELAEVELALGNVEAARRLAQGLQADFPNAPEGFALEARVLAQTRDYVRASPLFMRAYDLRPSYEAAMGAHLMRRQGALERPEEPLRRWLEIAPEDTRALLLLADYRQLNDRAAEALPLYEQVLLLEPANVVALNNAAWILAQSADPRSVEYARRAYESVPNAAPVLNTYGWALLMQGDVDAGLPYLREAASIMPESGDIQYHFAVGLAESGQRAQARDLLRRLLAGNAEFSQRANAESLLSTLQ